MGITERDEWAQLTQDVGPYVSGLVSDTGHSGRAVGPTVEDWSLLEVAEPVTNGPGMGPATENSQVRPGKAVRTWSQYLYQIDLRESREGLSTVAVHSGTVSVNAAPGGYDFEGSRGDADQMEYQVVAVAHFDSMARVGHNRTWLLPRFPARRSGTFQSRDHAGHGARGRYRDSTTVRTKGDSAR
jgi:hypothetical protein